MWNLRGYDEGERSSVTTKVAQIYFLTRQDFKKRYLLQTMRQLDIILMTRFSYKGMVFCIFQLKEIPPDRETMASVDGYGRFLKCFSQKIHMYAKRTDVKRRNIHLTVLSLPNSPQMCRWPCKSQKRTLWVSLFKL